VVRVVSKEGRLLVLPRTCFFYGVCGCSRENRSSELKDYLFHDQICKHCFLLANYSVGAHISSTVTLCGIVLWLLVYTFVSNWVIVSVFA
jgi:hypothetical protein